MKSKEETGMVYLPLFEGEIYKGLSFMCPFFDKHLICFVA
jgi:hypothetical protein